MYIIYNMVIRYLYDLMPHKCLAQIWKQYTYNNLYTRKKYISDSTACALSLSDTTVVAVMFPT